MENKLQFERIWVQRSIAVVLLFMFWNGFTDVFWMAPSLLFVPLQLFLWVILMWNYRTEVKAMPFVWLLGAGVLLNTLFLSFRFSDLIARTIEMQEAVFETSVIGTYISSILLIGTAWFMMYRDMLHNNSRKPWFLGLFFLLAVPIFLLADASGWFLLGVLMLVFMLKNKERKPFHWFVISQVVSISFSFTQFIYEWLFQQPH